MTEINTSSRTTRAKDFQTLVTVRETTVANIANRLKKSGCVPLETSDQAVMEELELYLSAHLHTIINAYVSRLSSNSQTETQPVGEISHDAAEAIVQSLISAELIAPDGNYASAIESISRYFINDLSILASAYLCEMFSGPSEEA